MKIKRANITILAVLVLLFSISAFAQQNGNGGKSRRREGAVFVATNRNNTTDRTQPANQVVMYNRAVDGRLTLVGYFNTGGQGSGPSQRFAGDGLGSAHSVQLSQDHRFLFVTNAGSNDISVFRVRRNSLKLVDVERTGDGSESLRFPNSVTQHGDLVYVLNSADEGSITGFRLNENGTLEPIARSTRILNANQGCPGNFPGCPPDTLFNPTQVSFTPDGRKLVVTIKDGPTAAAGTSAGIPNFTAPTGLGRILVFNVNNNGRPSANYTQTDLNNDGPFGFSFDDNGNILTTLFVGGPGLSASAGSFHIRQNGTLVPISRNVPNTQFDTCWLGNNGDYAYGANYTSGTISSYLIGADGSLTLLAAVAGTTRDLPCTAGVTCAPGANRQGSTPLDIRVSPNGRFLYNVLPGSGRVAAWRINADGSLTKIGEYGGLPRTIDGDMAPEERFGSGGSPAGIDVL